MKLTTKEMLRIALFAAQLSICAYICIPTAVPFTLQTFAVFLALAVLGGRNGTFAITVYLLLGAVGAPVFSGGRGGVFVLLGPTGGYLTGFLLTGFFYWFMQKRLHGKYAEAAVLLMGLLLCYAFGTAWFVLLMARAGKATSLFSALGLCVFPFILPDLVKLALAIFLSKKLKARAG